MGKQAYGIDPEMVAAVAQQVKDVVNLGVEVCLVIGGGNIFRGVSGAAAGMERATGDYMGMAGNGDERAGDAERAGNTRHGRHGSCPRSPSAPCASPTSAAVRCAISKSAGWSFLPLAQAIRFSPPIRRPRCARPKWDVLPFSRGHAWTVFYSADPEKDPDAVRYDQLSYLQVLSEDLKVMDASAVSLARREQHFRSWSFRSRIQGGFQRVLRHEGKFTIVS